MQTKFLSFGSKDRKAWKLYGEAESSYAWTALAAAFIAAPPVMLSSDSIPEEDLAMIAMGLSESALSEVWDSPEEDEAWQDL